jgi:protein-disulfide isomerase
MAENKQTVSVSPSALIFLGVVIVALVGFGGYMYGKVGTLEKGSTTNTQPSTTTTAAPQGATAAGEPFDLNVTKSIFDKNVVKFGDASRKLLVVEVSDPSCPYCHVANGDDPELAMGAQFNYLSKGGTYQPPLPEIRKLVDSGQASYAFVYFPGHTAGETAVKALYCAFDQGKFWQAHDLLYSNKGYALMNTTMEKDANGKALDNAGNRQLVVNFLSTAVDSNTLSTCLSSGKYDSRTTDETNLAQSTLLNPQNGGTPTFVLNATRFTGAYSWTDMKATADAAVK